MQATRNIILPKSVADIRACDSSFINNALRAAFSEATITPGYIPPPSPKTAEPCVSITINLSNAAEEKLAVLAENHGLAINDTISFILAWEARKFQPF